MSDIKAILLEDLLGIADASVRITDDGLLYAVDLVAVVTGKDGHYAAKTIRDLSEEVFCKDKYQERRLTKR
jgi:hypothetical protein